MRRRDPIDIGEAARRIGVSPATLRLYERRGLLPKVDRSEGGYRRYSPDDLHRARLVRRARRAGLSMRQIAQAMASEHGTCGLRRLLRDHLACMERECRKLLRLQRHLRRWLGAR